MRIADTSALYAAFVEEDQHHYDAREAFTLSGPTIVPAEILSETLGLLQLRMGFSSARAAGQAIRATPHTRIEPTPTAMLTRAWDTFVEARGKLSYADSIVLAWCAAEAARPISFDKEIHKRIEP